MIYEIGTISTKANDPKITGKNTLWKNSVTKVSVGQIILIQSGNTIYQNSIRSVESDTQMTLSFPVPVALTDVKYVISITMIGSVSDGVNKATAMVTESYQLMMILNRLMTESGVIKVVLPDGTEMQLRTEKERDRLLDGKFDKAGGEVLGTIKLLAGSVTAPLLQGVKDGNIIQVDPTRQSVNVKRGDTSFTNHLFPVVSGTLMQIGDGGWMSESGYGLPTTISKLSDYRTNSVGYAYSATQTDLFKSSNHHFLNIFGYSTRAYGNQLAFTLDERIGYRCIINNAVGPWYDFYTTKNTTKDANGNLKAASPIVKLFADDIELNDESEGVEMEHLGVGHYLIKGVVGFNADGAWGINNGFVIPQDHNGKNMVLIDYEVRPDGDIEIFVFHQQNADMPERFQNKRIKHFDEEGVPVYFENYEPCDVPESRWIDMRVEMPPNSFYNQKQAEAERLAKLEAERLAQEEAEMDLEI
ncbi:hypothetical protein [Providencia rettgeri]|uniref:phage tail fiber protein n=3 Tax=Providencia TaxID=586 RepID=UPI002360162A|nr:hypothetical protein [Providencia rettgeri]